MQHCTGGFTRAILQRSKFGPRDGKFGYFRDREGLYYRIRGRRQWAVGQISSSHRVHRVGAGSGLVEPATFQQTAAAQFVRCHDCFGFPGDGGLRRLDVLNRLQGNTGGNVYSYSHRNFRKLEPSSRAHSDRAVSSVSCSVERAFQKPPCRASKAARKP